MSTLIAFIVVFGTIVFIHELGHFLVAKLAGVKVFEFSLGFGPQLIRKRIGETVYSLRLLPLGGFVKLAGMDEAEELEDAVTDDDPRNFNRKPLAWRMATIAAGPTMNFLLAIILFTVFYMTVVVPPTIGFVAPDSAAEQGGVQSGDEIIAINGQSVDTSQEIVKKIQQSAERPLTLTVQRGNETVTLEVTPQGVEGQGRLGVDIYDEKPQYPLGQSLVAGTVQTYRVTKELVVSLYRMVTRKMPAELAGPIGIVQVVGQAANQGLVNLLLLAAVLNINLGLLNFLPVPVLDGGWLVILGIEAIRRKPLAPEHRGIAQFIGLALLILLMVFATFKDITRLNIFS